ncbi:MAG: hypothetical protein JSS82_01955 [Bacteroidetes bacterium]|nr:hypothetical protein [Bacteroidota bacterium]
MSLTRKTTVISLFWSGLNTVQFFLKNIFFVSLFLKYRSAQDYAFWIILMSFYSMTLYVCDGYVRYCLNEYNLEFYRDRTKAAKHFRNGLTFLIVISLAVLVLLFAILHYLAIPAAVFKTGVRVIDNYQLHYCLFIVMTLSLGQSIVRYISGAIEPEGKIHISSRYTTMYGICETALYFLCIFLNASLIAFFLVLLAGLFLVNIIYLVSLLRKHKVYNEGLRGNIKGGFALFRTSLFFLLNNFFEKLTMDGINFIVAFMYPLVSLPAYATTRTMANVMVSTGNTFVSVATIEFQRLRVQNEGERLMKVLHMIWLALGICINCGLVLVSPLLMKIYAVWTHGKLAVDPVFFFIIFSVVVLNVYGMVITIFLKSLNALNRLFPVSIARAAIILLLAVLMPKHAVYLAVALLVAEFIMNVFLLNFMLYREVKGTGYTKILPTLCWSILPYLATAIFLPLNFRLALPYLTSSLAMLLVLAAIYALQLKYIKNNLLVDNLRSAAVKLRIVSN